MAPTPLTFSVYIDFCAVLLLFPSYLATAVSCAFCISFSLPNQSVSPAAPLCLGISERAQSTRDLVSPFLRGGLRLVLLMFKNRKQRIQQDTDTWDGKLQRGFFFVNYEQHFRAESLNFTCRQCDQS